MLITKFDPLFAPETEAADKSAATAAETEAAATAAAAKAAEEEAEVAAAAKAEAEAGELEIEGLEKTDDGYTYTIGGSVYKGATLKEVMSNARKGADEKAKSSLELDRSLRELKASRAIREPEDDDEEDIPEPRQQEIITSVFQGTGIEPRMANWDDEQWEAYRQEKELSDFKVSRMADRARDLKRDAEKRITTETSTWLNRTTLRKEITPAVRDMVAEAGVDPEQFGPLYLQILKDKQYTDAASGLLNTAKILQAMHREILKAIKPAADGAASRKAAEEKAKLEEKKRLLGSGGGGGPKPKVNEKSPPNIEEASKRALALLK